MPKQPTTITLSPTFKMVFLSVLGITVTCILLSCFLIGVGFGESDLEKAVINSCLTTWKLGFGAMVGLLGGKAI